MIDTDKYEGHDNWEGTKVNMVKEANAQLIADAPLLLAEVKRLSKAFETMGESLREMGKDYCIHCFRVYHDTSADGLEEFRHQNGECLT